MKRPQSPQSLAAQVADVVLRDDGLPSLTEMMANDDSAPGCSIARAFRRLRDHHRGKSYDAWLNDVCAASEKVSKALPESQRGLVTTLCDLYGDEEVTGLDAAFEAGVEVGKRLSAGGAL